MTTLTTRFFSGLVVSVALSLAAISEAQPQDPLTSARAELTGPQAREWVLTQIIVSMGPGNHCQQGEALRFMATQDVVIESCVGGQMTNRKTHWKLRGNGALDPILNFDGIDYLLTFHNAGNKHYIRLRQPGAGKIDPTFDREYRLSQD